MKKTQWIILGSLLCAQQVMANARLVPFVTKSSGSGYTPEEWVQHEECSVFSDRIVVTRQMGPLTVTENFPITFKFDQLKALFDLAKQEKLTQQDNNLCDAPGTSLWMNNKAFDRNDPEDTLDIYTTGGCGSPRLERDGAASFHLKEWLSQYCPKTY